MARATSLFVGGGYSDIAPHQIADLHGRRFVTCSEFKSGDVLRVEVMKTLTGGESTELNGCYKYGRAFSFRPQAKFLLDSNYLLEVDSPDLGTWRRIRLIAFDQIISGKVKKDLHFDKKLWAERSGILNWIIVGLRFWNVRDRTLLVPEVILQASRHYEKEQDRLEQFIAAEGVRGRECSIELSRFTAAFQDWINAKGSKREGGKRAVKDRLIKKGFRLAYDERQRCDRIEGLTLRLPLDDPRLGFQDQ
jgi:putative DNA primase/helicase